jgi:RND family efflux transporter MFP subunit
MESPDPGNPNHTHPGHHAPRPGRLIAWALLAIGVAGAAGLWPRWKEQQATRARTRDLAVPTVSVVSPKPAQPTVATPFPAELRPETEAILRARANGFIRKLHADIGSRVDAGQTVAEIDIPDLDAETRQARAEGAQAEAARDLADKTARRWAELYKSQNVSQQEHEEKQADLALKSATVDAAKARVQRLEELQGFSKVTAPFAGIITARGVDIGDLVNASTPQPLFRLIDTRRLRVWVRVPQPMTELVVEGSAAELTLPEKPGRTFPARVVRTAGAMASDSRTLLVELSVENPNGELLAGSYGQVRFATPITQARTTLPANALLFRPDGPQVARVNSDDTVELRSVTLGRDFGREVEVLGGVAPTDRVILNPRDSIATGQKVRLNTPPQAQP